MKCVSLKGRNYKEVKWHKKIFLSVVIPLKKKVLFFFFSCAYVCVSCVYSTQTRNMYIFICISVFGKAHNCILKEIQLCTLNRNAFCIGFQVSQEYCMDHQCSILMHSNTFNPYHSALPGEELLNQLAAWHKGKYKFA